MNSKKRVNATIAKKENAELLGLNGRLELTIKLNWLWLTFPPPPFSAKKHRINNIEYMRYHLFKSYPTLKNEVTSDRKEKKCHHYLVINLYRFLSFKGYVA